MSQDRKRDIERSNAAIAELNDFSYLAERMGKNRAADQKRVDEELEKLLSKLSDRDRRELLENLYRFGASFIRFSWNIDQGEKSVRADSVDPIDVIVTKRPDTRGSNER